MATVTVLAIDGGGIRGIIPAAFLNRLEQETGHCASDLFDYMAGTSTGGILALGLGLKRSGQIKPYSAAELMSLYTAEGGHIFSRGLLHTIGALGNLNGPKYPDDGVDQVLQKYFAGMRLRDARTNVLVTAYEIERRCPFFFRSWQAQAAGTSATHDFDAWQVARSTSAAPTFFPPHQAEAADGRTYALIDGGMYANNPALCAWVEAHDRHPAADILVISLGTGNEKRPVRFDDARNWGLAGWAPHLIDIIFDGVSGTVDVELDEMLNSAGYHNHFRFQTDIHGSEQEMDNTDPENLQALRALGEELASGPVFSEVCSRLGQVLAERAALHQGVPLPVAPARGVA
ncbi:MAG: patatin-like phospholipase family protein [Myxococcales bacterium]